MTKKYNIAVIGATGNVGRETLNILAERHFPINKIYAIASDNSLGREVRFGEKILHINSIKIFNFHDIEIAFFVQVQTFQKNLYQKLLLVIV
ncbi:Aspartate-semialdehyde dehydrogenase [Rickettsia prowazekii str. GvF12]|nr:Aspartate-semialdehyde dehydrogenase [Rickettsia prowazekii str. GvF12]